MSTNCLYQILAEVGYIKNAEDLESVLDEFQYLIPKDSDAPENLEDCIACSSYCPNFLRIENPKRFFNELIEYLKKSEEDSDSKKSLRTRINEFYNKFPNYNYNNGFKTQKEIPCKKFPKRVYFIN